MGIPIFFCIRSSPNLGYGFGYFACYVYDGGAIGYDYHNVYWDSCGKSLRTTIHTTQMRIIF